MKPELRTLEAVLFAAAEPLDQESLTAHLPEGAPLNELLAELQAQYSGHGIELAARGGRWLFQTTADLQPLLERYKETPRRLSRAALEVLAIIAYHPSSTRAEIEDIRGVSLSSGTLDILMEIEWVKILGKRDVLGHPTIYGTTDTFLQHFGINKIEDLPDIEELKAAGLMEKVHPQVLALQEGKNRDEEIGFEESPEDEV